MRFCECGCSLEVKGYDYRNGTKKPIRFRKGHWSKTDHFKKVRNARPCEHNKALYSDRDCECGCGLRVTGWNYHKNEPTRFIRGHCDTGQFRKGISKRGQEAPGWKGGRRLNNNGYILIWKPDHPYAVHGSVLEHRLVMEQHIGRYLLPTELVHHKNHKRSDNRIENLQIMNPSEHTGYHSRLYWGKNSQLRCF